VPSAEARRRVEGRAAARLGPILGAPIWTWDDLWAEVGARHPDPPAHLSDASARAALRLAIRGASEERRLRIDRALAQTAGYRRDLAGRIAAWTALGRDPDSPRPDSADPDGWEVYGRYRRMLRSLGGEDRAGFAAWAARVLPGVADALLGPGSGVVLHAPTTGGRPAATALRALVARSEHALITLPWEDDPDRREIYADLESLRRDLLALGFEESHHGPPADRPAGLASLARDLFRVPPAPPLARADGLALRGAPRGEGIALAAAREVRDRLDRFEAEPEEILVLVPRWDDPAEVLLETLRAWGVPACGGPGRPASADPAVSALLAALRLPLDDFESSALAHLLRHGRIRPRWDGADAPLALPHAAAAVREARVFRGRQAILTTLFDAGKGASEESDRRDLRRRARARLAHPIVEHLTRLLDAAARPVPWRAQLAKLRTIASELGLDAPDALGRLLDALEDQAEALDGLKLGRKPWRWESFVREVAAVARESAPEPPPPRPGCVRVATVAEAEGASARVVVLAGLEEGTFPARDAIDLDPNAPDAEADPGAGADPAAGAFARELRRFLGVLDAAEDRLVLIYPTTDEKGQSLLPAGFVEDVRRQVEQAALAEITRDSRRLDPVLPPELAVAPCEARVLAVSEAIAGDPARLRRLAADPAHRPALDGVASALRVAHERVLAREFGPFDGRLSDPALAARIAADFPPDRFAFSASQLETLAYCPFKFYIRHVLKLEPIDDREELDEDFTWRGHVLHAALEELHLALQADPDAAGPALVRAVADGIEAAVRRCLERQSDPASPVDAGLRAIDAERLLRTGRRYAAQFATYSESAPGLECHRFEAVFGKSEDGPPGLVLGDGEAAVGLQGFIDRIDLVRLDGKAYFRIIDYKTGASPSPGDVAKGLALQLPLYAMAVERLLLDDAEPLDMAYWELKKDGHKALLSTRKLDAKSRLRPLDDWPGFTRRIEAYVLGLVDRLRRGDFPVAPRTPDCTRACEYRHVCRIGQVRNLGKSWPECPTLEPSP
jgi:RecB family exonuclease